jgi:Tol biopolymer transport system component
MAGDRLIPSPTATPSATMTPRPAPLPTASPTPPPALSGRIAFPIDDGLAHYDIWLKELPRGEPFLLLPRARQPNFSKQGQLLVNNENSPNGENLGLMDTNNTWLGLVSDTPEDRHPFWSPDGSRYVYANPQLLTDPQTRQYLSYLFIPCTLRRPSEEGDEKCRDTGGQSKLSPGAYPVWTDDNRIALFADLGGAGIYLVNANTARDYGDAVVQRVILVADGRPSDAQGNQLYFSARSLDQNWEAYVVNLDGSGLVNLSNSPTSYDGLPTVSPNGAWVAFVSNRNEHWGIWVVPISGGAPVEVVDLSKINTNPSPWGEGERDWTEERISWGP